MTDSTTQFVHGYDLGTFVDLLHNHTETPIPLVEDKPHTKYFKEYFKALEAATIVAEYDYVDRHFVEDHAGYYDRCFHDYPKKSMRLHFFKSKFDETQLLQVINSSSETEFENEIKQSYIGFIVVKPIPEKFIGRTCLTTYDSDNDRRQYPKPLVREYPVNMFGITLEVKNTLAYQEQDSVVAACATSALWNVFHATGKSFQHAIPSPLEITRYATKNPQASVLGTFPNNGLTGTQMAQAIRAVGLEPSELEVGDVDALTGATYAYLNAGIPLILLIYLTDTSPNPNPNLEDGAYHAVTITGYSIKRDRISSSDPERPLLTASRIDELYVHDDQVGPFARMKLDGKTVMFHPGTGHEKHYTLSTSWPDRTGNFKNVRAIPDYVIAPLYPKIRITFEFIKGIVLEFDRFMRFLSKRMFGLNTEEMLELIPELEWDIRLERSNSFKEDIRKCHTLTEDDRKEILVGSLPRFIWRATAKLEDGSNQFELLFDATDFECGKPFMRTIDYPTRVTTTMKNLSAIFQHQREVIVRPFRPIVEWFASH